PGAYALVGMAAVFSGASRATITAIIILFEMTLNYHIILPLMLACVVSDAISILIYKETIYTKKLIRRGIKYEYDREVSEFKVHTVKDSMVKDVVSVLDTSTVMEVSDMIINTGYQAFPVIDEDGNLTGMIAHHDIRKAIEKGRKDALMRDLKTKILVVVNPDTLVEDAMELMAVHGIGHLPVVNSSAPEKLVGFISRSDVIFFAKEQFEKDSEDA
ncbi:MAG TPA: CBS domain-containing protein, partial [Euryarchaeota archaeon]|nr:CBS domain-containing protein [Euryarchaeota archaeon]